MMKAFVALALAACTVDGGGSTDSNTNVPGRISMNETWTGTKQILVDTTIDMGVTVTASAGASIAIKNGTVLRIAGTLDIEGTGVSHVTIQPDGGAATFGGILVMTGGTLLMHHGQMTGGEITTNGTAHANIFDSQFSHAPGDLLVMNGGNIDVEYSAIGLEPGLPDTTHCDMHMGGLGDTIKVTHTNISTSSYGVMFYSGGSADFTYNSFFGNSVTDVDIQPGVSGDFSNSFFGHAAPSGVGLVANNLASARLPACDGTNDATCAGPRP